MERRSLSSLFEDARHASRHLWRARTFAFGVVAVLCISASANTTAFALLSAVTLHRLPVPAADRLVLIGATDDAGRVAQPIYFSTFNRIQSLPPFERATLFSGGGLLWVEARGVTGEGFIEAVTPGYHESLGLAPYRGRFISNDDAPADGVATAVAVISHGFWQRHFAGDAQAVGEPLLINKVPFTIIGVMPPQYSGIYIESGVDFAVPLGALGRHLATNQYPLDPRRPLRAAHVIARLRPGYTIEQARVSLETAWAALRTESLPPALSGDERRAAEAARVSIEPLASGVSRLRARYGDRLRLFSAVTLTFVLIGSLNIAGLMASRAASRDREFALHLALGATPTTLVRRLVCESMWLSLAGSVLGMVIAWWATTAIAATLWDGAAPLQLSTTPRPGILLLSFAIAFGISLVISAGPVLRLRRLRSPLAQSEPTIAGPKGRFAPALIAAQVSLSMVLVVLAMMFTATLISLGRLDPGVDGATLRWTRLLQQPGGYQGMDDSTYYPELLRTVAAVPGLRAVALSHQFPSFYNFGDLVPAYGMSRSGSDGTDGEVSGMMESISPGFFDTIEVPLMTGRDFTWRDDRSRSGVVIINQRLRDALFGGRDPIGQHLRIGDDPSRQSLEIVGVVGDATMGSYRRPRQPVAFRPKLQEPRFTRTPVIVFRTALPAAEADRAVADAVRRLGREYVRRGYSFDEQIDNAMRDERMTAALASGFAALAIALAGIGLFAQLAYCVAQRSREIALRMAVGASRAAILWVVIRQGVAAVVAGALIGGPASFAAVRVAQSRGFEIAAPSFWLLVAATLFMAGSAAAASAVPAWRGASIAPATILRDHSH